MNAIYCSTRLRHVLLHLNRTVVLVVSVFAGTTIAPGASLAWDEKVHPRLNGIGVDLVEHWSRDIEGNDFYLEIYARQGDKSRPGRIANELIDGGLEEDTDITHNGNTDDNCDATTSKSTIAPTNTNLLLKHLSYPRSRHHFYHPFAKVGLSDRILHRDTLVGRCNDAVSWARDDEGENWTWTGAISKYGYGSNAKGRAYERVGRVAHLVGDMGQPDHVHLEPHSLSSEGLRKVDDNTGIDKYAWENWAIDDKVSPSLSSDYPPHLSSPDIHNFLPVRYDRMESHLTELAKLTFRMSSLSGTLRKDTRNPASGLLADMFDVKYLAFQWHLHNKTGYEDRNDDDRIGDWDGRYTDDDEFYETSSVTAGYSVRGEYYIETDDGLNANAIPTIIKVCDYEIDSNDALRHTGRILCRNGDNSDRKQSLQRLWTSNLLPEAARRIAGLYMHFFDIVNHPPILTGVQVKQGDATVYEQHWQPNVELLGSVQNGQFCLIDKITKRDRTMSESPTEWINGSGRAAIIRLNFGGGYDATAVPPSPNDTCYTPLPSFPLLSLPCNLIFRTPCPGCVETACPITNSYADVPKRMADVTVRIVNVDGISDYEVIGTLLPNEDPLLSETVWEGELVPPMDGSLDGTHDLEVSGTDQAPHYTGYVRENGDFQTRNFPGDTLDSDPATLALTSAREPYDWSGYEQEVPDDKKNQLHIDVTTPSIRTVGLEIDGPDRTVYFFEVKDVTSGLTKVENTVSDSTIDVEPFEPGTTDPVLVTYTTNSGLVSMTVYDAANNSFNYTFTVTRPTSRKTGIGTFGIFELLVGLLAIIYVRRRKLVNAAR